MRIGQLSGRDAPGGGGFHGTRQIGNLFERDAPGEGGFDGTRGARGAHGVGARRLLAKGKRQSVRRGAPPLLSYRSAADLVAAKRAPPLLPLLVLCARRHQERDQPLGSYSGN
eukprot:9224220-Pyramimonas_sp.AAC.1